MRGELTPYLLKECAAEVLSSRFELRPPAPPAAVAGPLRRTLSAVTDAVRTACGASAKEQELVKPEVRVHMEQFVFSVQLLDTAKNVPLGRRPIDESLGAPPLTQYSKAVAALDDAAHLPFMEPPPVMTPSRKRKR